MVLRIITAIETRFSAVAGSLTGIIIFSSSPVSSCGAVARVSSTMRLAAFSVVNELNTHVTRISIIVPLSTSSLSTLCPSGSSRL